MSVTGPSWPSCFFLFPDDNLSTCNEILTKLDTCIDIKVIWFRIANGLLSVFELSANNTIMAGYYCFTFFFVTNTIISY